MSFVENRILHELCGQKPLHEKDIFDEKKRIQKEFRKSKNIVLELTFPSICFIIFRWAVAYILAPTAYRNS